ncbi:TPA: Dot/Icm T4SS effector kinase LegK4 [Legionella pneumophila]
MKLLRFHELKSLQSMDEKALDLLIKVLGNKGIRKLIKSADGKPISREIMIHEFGIDCQILFITTEASLKPIIVPTENKISGGGKSYCEQYKVYALDDGKTYFLKSVKIDAGSLTEFTNEKDTLKKLGRLEGTFFNEQTQVHYILTTFIKGIDLSRYKNSLPLGINLKHFWEVLGIMTSVCHQVKQFHELGLIHRDLKPGNIMLDVDMQCHLVDFGSSSSDEEPKPSSWGTACYLAPELEANEDFIAFSQASDLFALAYSLNELFNPFRQVKFAKVDIGIKNKHLVLLYSEIEACITGLMSNEIPLRALYFSRILQLQRVPENFKSRPEAYTYMIMLLTQWKSCYEIPEMHKELDEIIAEIKVAYENHEQDVVKITRLLEQLSKADWVLNSHKALLSVLIKSFAEIKQPDAGYDDILPRRFESDFVSHLIKTPTAKMMAAIKQVSDAIVKILEQYEHSPTESFEYEVLQDFLEQMVQSDILFGAPKEKIQISDVINILKANRPEDFVQIQHISFKFAQVALRDLALHDLPKNDLTGSFLEILRKYQAKYMPEETSLFDLYHHMAALRDNNASKVKKGEGYRFRAFICDELFYGDEIFSTGDNRGREGKPNQRLQTNQVGLMKFEHSAHTKGLLTLNGQSWYADCKTQLPNYDSIHYLSALKTDCPYITGPSGMTSLFMNMMFLLLNPKDQEVILSYSLGVMAYVVGAGYHSIKEILIPMVKCVGIMPDYPQHNGIEYLTAPPLYNHYFKAIEEFDKEFAGLHEKIWQEHLAYFRMTYMPVCMRNDCLPHQFVSMEEVSLEVKEMIDIVSTAVKNCIGEHKVKRTGDMGLFLSIPSEQTKALDILSKVCQQQVSLTAIFRQIQAYFKGTFETEEGIIINREMQLKFIAYFFDVLKESPTLLSQFNLTLRIENTIGVHQCELRSSKRKELFLEIKKTSIAANEERMVANHEPRKENRNVIILPY